jgi:hypothetical protein
LFIFFENDAFARRTIGSMVLPAEMLTVPPACERNRSVEKRWLEGFGGFISKIESSIVHAANRQAFHRPGSIVMRPPTKRSFHDMNQRAAARS